jgi:energy-coupling factor transport system substrate-specific component
MSGPAAAGTAPAGGTQQRRTTRSRGGRAVGLTRWSTAAIVAASLVGVLAFGWPLLAPGDSQLVAHATDAPLLFAGLVPLLLAVAISLVSDGGLDAKAVALLAILSAVAAALRALGAGIAGLEPIWVVIVLGGYSLGAGFGFLLGASCLLASALVTGGIGPWLPFQVLGAAWVGLGAGLLSGLHLRLRGRRLPGRGTHRTDAGRSGAIGPTTRLELVVLAGYGAVAAVAYGWLLNLWFWPTLGGLPEPLAFVPGAGAAANFRHWITFNLTTSLGYDLPRAVLTATLVSLLGVRVLGALGRARRRGGFEDAVTFTDPEEPGPRPDLRAAGGNTAPGHKAAPTPHPPAPPPAGQPRAHPGPQPNGRPLADPLPPATTARRLPLHPGPNHG